MVEIIVITALDGFVVYDLRTNEATHYKSYNWSTLNLHKHLTTEEAIKDFEKFRETL